MANQTKNLGQVAGLYIGVSAPENTTLIWFDSTPSIMCHKVYSEQLQQWVILDSSVISSITYQVLKNLAQGQGLVVGQWFKITDKSNALAIAITSTKVQYTDTIGNILIDDLGGSIQYCVTHTNLLIDDVVGVWDAASEKVIFRFDVVTPNFLGDDFILAKSKRNNVWKLVKYKIKDFLSTNSGNAISWNNGFYLDFQSRFSALLDVPGGAVSKSVFDAQIASLNQTLTNVSENVQNVQQQAAATINAAVTDEQVYSKHLPIEPTPGAGADILQGDTLSTIVNKVHRWIQQLKWATGIGLSANYAEATQLDYVNNNDSVESAIAKLAFWVRTFGSYNANGTDSVILSQGYSPHPGVTPTPGQSNLTSILEDFAYHLGILDKASGSKLDGSYSPQNHTITAGQSSVLQAIEKLMYDVSVINAAAWKTPKWSMVFFSKIPTFDNVMENAGIGWFPCGVSFVGTNQACQTEKNKWLQKYPSRNLQIDITTSNGTDYRMTWKSVDGNTLPDPSDKVLGGMSYQSENSFGHVGGSNTHVITMYELPKHNHNTLNSDKDNMTVNISQTVVTSVLSEEGKRNDSAGATGPRPVGSISTATATPNVTLRSAGLSNAMNMRQATLYQGVLIYLG